MRLTTFTDYSLRVLIYAATAPAGRATIAEVAASFGISQHHLVKVVHLLGRLGVLENTRGRNGGFKLARPAAAINVGEVIRATEGDAVPAECFAPEGGSCPITGTCRLERALHEAVEAFHAVLDRYTLADLVGNRKTLVAILHRTSRVEPRL
jgi:Rrf2 family nitric oxide-sensitive transcriptional repressor